MALLRILLILLLCAPLAILAILFQDIWQALIILLPLFSSYCIAACFFSDENDLIMRINTWFIVLCCQVVAIAQVISFFHALRWQAFFVFSLVIAILCVFIPSRIQKAWRADYADFRRCGAVLFNLARQDIVLKWFLIVLAGTLLWRIFLILYVPPNNFDSMTYHLSRVAYWMQHHSLAHFPTHNFRQVQNPFNAEIMLLWLMLKWRSDILCGFIQFICYLLSGTLLFRGIRWYFDAAARPALLCALFWYSLPLTVIQSTSTQNDLIVSYFLTAGLLYMLLGASGDKKRLVISGLALGLALGTKSISFIFLFLLACLVIVLAWKRALRVRCVLFWIAMCFVSAVSFGIASYIQNRVSHGSFLSREAAVVIPGFIMPDSLLSSEVAGSLTRPLWTALSGYISNFFQLLYSIATNQTGLHILCRPLAFWYNWASGWRGAYWFDALHIPVNVMGFYGRKTPFVFMSLFAKNSTHESVAGYGLLGPVMLLAAFLVLVRILMSYFKPCRSGQWRYGALSFLFLGTLILVACLVKWNFTNTRYTVMGVLAGGIALLLPLAAARSGFLKSLRNILCVYCMIFMLPTTFMNVKKTLPDIFLHERSALRYHGMEELFGVMRALDYRVHDASIGVLLAPLDWDYPLFGEGLRRSVVPIGTKDIGRFAYIVATSRGLLNAPVRARALRQGYEVSAFLGVCDGNEWLLFGLKKDTMSG